MSNQESNSNSAAVLLALINWAAFYRVDEAQRRNQHGKKQPWGFGEHPESLALIPEWAILLIQGLAFDETLSKAHDFESTAKA